MKVFLILLNNARIRGEVYYDDLTLKVELLEFEPLLNVRRFLEETFIECNEIFSKYNINFAFLERIEFTYYTKDNNKIMYYLLCKDFFGNITIDMDYSNLIDDLVNIHGGFNIKSEEYYTKLLNRGKLLTHAFTKIPKDNIYVIHLINSNYNTACMTGDDYLNIDERHEINEKLKPYKVGIQINGNLY